MSKSTPISPINPAHYRRGKMETIKVIKSQLTVEEYKGFCKGLIIKYICRADAKGGIIDYKKADWYLDELIKTLETEANKEGK